MNDAERLNRDLETTEVIWNLDDLYSGPDSIPFQEDCRWCEQEAAAIAALYRGRVKLLEATNLRDLVERLECLESRIGRLATYAFLHFTTQVDNEAAGALQQKIHELADRCSGHLVFFELEWNKISKKRAQLLLDDAVLAPYRHYLASLRRYRPHQLKEIEEKLLIELRSVGRSSWNTLFDKIIGTMRFGERGRTEEEVLSDLYHADRDVRRRAADDLTAGLKSQSHILTHIFNTLAADKMIGDRLRRYPDWISSRNLDNQVDNATVATLVDTVVDRYDLVARYYRLKAGLLGLEKLVDYDRYAPLPALPTIGVDWKRCREIVLDSFAGFSPKLGDIAARFFDRRWIHAPVLAGKRGGAFAHPATPEVHPYVLVNYAGTLRDISTVAHELGHGVHQVLAAERGYFNSDTPLVLAETASVFAELLVFKAQLSLLDSAEQRRAFICQKLESIFATVFRQVAMNRFEKLMHEGRREHGELSSEQLGDYWMQTQQQMFGDSVLLRDDYRIWWSYIPHFLSTPGYVYAYAFGELLVLALYNRYLQQGPPFIDAYLGLLAAGGSATPSELLKPFAIDLDDPSFWNQGLQVIDGMLAEVEQN
ncbi:MAG: M3 family oligoendopeptidase [Desulfofustis sp.]|nr:M3 family oligoendopeptidase [Desulfofustis sp.]